MNFVDYFKFLIETYGYGGLILSILIVLLFIFLPYLFKKNNKEMKDGLKEVTTELTKAIKDENRELIAGLKDNQTKLIDNQFELVKNLLIDQKVEHDKNLSTRDSVSLPIQNKINHLKDYYNSSRASVFEFHNSLVNLNGLPFKWYDLIYESVARGVHAVSFETKNMPFNILLPIVQEVENGRTVLFRKDDIEKFYDQSSVLYDFCLRHKINDMIVAPLINKDMQLVGLIVLEYSGDNYIGSEDVIIDDLELEAHAISTLLELK